MNEETKKCRRCGAPVPIARVISLCDDCIKNSRIRAMCDE
jgi:NMD protein affecting ribosome stability and mRNA decay